MPQRGTLADTFLTETEGRQRNLADRQVEIGREEGSEVGSAGEGFTRMLAQWISTADAQPIGPAAVTWAKHAMLDWLAVSIAGAREPLVEMLAAEYGGPRDLPCGLPGRTERASPADAALINGAAGHALDFDDVSPNMCGHPTVPVAPAALALAQAQGASGMALLRAIVVGHEVESQIGRVLGASHYEQGFHTTGTVGTFGAAAACATLRGLDATATAHALGLAATQAAGLKCMFGTMAKPLHAGKAAMNGLMAVQLAARGFTAQAGAIECAQGFARTQVPQAGSFPMSIDTSHGMAIERTLFKFHASCYLTHSMLEAIARVRREHDLGLDALDAMTIVVSTAHRGVCDIANPDTGLAVKFSLQHLAALALDGAATSSLALYSDQTACNPRYVQARQRVALQVEPGASRHGAAIVLRTRDGREIHAEANVAVPASDLDAQWQRLTTKAHAIVAPVIGAARFEALVSAVQTLDRSPTIDNLFEAIQ